MYGGTYMLAKPDAKVDFDEAGNAVSVTSEGETVKAKIVVGDPSAPPLSFRRSQDLPDPAPPYLPTSPPASVHVGCPWPLCCPATVFQEDSPARGSWGRPC